MPAARAVYLDHNATTPPRPEATTAAATSFTLAWANPSSTHGPGRKARDAVERARADVAAFVGVDRAEIVFTSGGTEACRLGLVGLARAARQAGRPARLVASPLEHPAVKAAIEDLAREGFAVEWLAVDGAGRLRAGDLARALAPGAAVVVCAAVNHEIGNRFDVADVARHVRGAGALLFVDAVQAAGRGLVQGLAAHADAMALSAHKLGGLKGTGALWLRRGVGFEPGASPGQQERGRRGGTENVPGIVAMAAACGATARDAGLAARLADLGARLEAGVLAIEGATLVGDPDARAPGVVNARFPGAPGQLVAMALDAEGIAVSTGSACSSGSLKPSPVLLALGLEAAQAREAVRFSLGWNSSADDVAALLAVLPEVVARVRAAEASATGAGAASIGRP